ncbi:MAG: hypothetical protein QMD02_07240 [Bacteroidales bacterium]|nr:hypothetical protein [Bacteroidales bacterium]
MFRKIVNIFAVVIFVAIWFLLYFFKSNYEHSTFQEIENVHPQSNNIKIAPSTPVFYDSTKQQIYGFCKENSQNEISQFFLFSLKDENIDFYPLPTKYNKLLGYAKNESEYFWMSYNDSLSSLIKFNKRQNEISIYHDSILLDINQVIGFGLKNNKPEIALRNPLKNNIIIYTFSDTVADVRLVRFPIFYQSFSLPTLGYIKNNNWQFLCKALYSEQQDFWKRYDTTKNLNIIRFQENVALPFFYDLLPYPYYTPITSLPYYYFHYIPTSHLLFKAGHFSYIDNPTPNKNTINVKNNIIWSLLDDSIYMNFLRYDTIVTLLSIKKELKNNKQYFYSLSDTDYKNLLFFVPDTTEIYSYAYLNEDSILLLTNDFQYLYIDKQGNSYAKFNIIDNICITINENFSQKMKILDANIPGVKALGFYLIISGPFILWFLVWLVAWLFKIFKKDKDKYSYYTSYKRKKKENTIFHQTFIGSIVYIAISLILFNNFLLIFNII